MRSYNKRYLIPLVLLIFIAKGKFVLLGEHNTLVRVVTINRPSTIRIGINKRTRSSQQLRECIVKNNHFGANIFLFHE